MQNEKTLRKPALEQYLAGGFNQDAIVYQVSMPSPPTAQLVHHLPWDMLAQVGSGAPA